MKTMKTNTTKQKNMKTNVNEKVKNVYRSLTKSGDYKTARRLLKQLIQRQNKAVIYLPIMLSCDADWKLANMFDPNHNGYKYSIK